MPLEERDEPYVDSLMMTQAAHALKSHLPRENIHIELESALAACPLRRQASRIAQPGSFSCVCFDLSWQCFDGQAQPAPNCTLMASRSQPQTVL